MSKFFDFDSECFAKYDTVCSHIFNYACLRRKACSYQRGSKVWKNCVHQNIFENGWWEDALHTPHPSPLDSPLAIS